MFTDVIDPVMVSHGFAERNDGVYSKYRDAIKTEGAK